MVLRVLHIANDDTNNRCNDRYFLSIIGVVMNRSDTNDRFSNKRYNDTKDVIIIGMMMLKKGTLGSRGSSKRRARGGRTIVK